MEETQTMRPTRRHRPKAHRTLANSLIVGLSIVLLSLASCPRSVRADDFPVCPAPPAAGTTVSCAPGSFNNNQNCCYQCAPGRFSSGVNQAQCDACAVGTFAHLAGQTACDACLGGHYAPETGASACALCYPGSFTAGNASQCTLCTATPKAYTPDPGAFSCANVCSDPNYQVAPDGTQCKPVNGNAAATPATPCGDGYYVSADGATCVKCPEGTYAAGTNQRFCSVCTPGRIAQGTMNSICTQCVAGKFTSNSGTTLCGDCAFGTFSAVGASACTTCPTNTYQVQGGQPSCLSCVGEAQPSSCTTCVPGRFLDTTPSTHGVNTCSSCDAGKYSTTDNASECTFCEPGFFQANTRQTGCVACDPGTVSSTRGAALCDQCSAGKYSNSTQCANCAPGTFSLVGQATCTACPNGQYQPDAGQSTCLQCDASSGAVVTNGNTTCAVPPVVIATCAFGQRYNATNDTCIDCDPGTSSNLRNPSNCSACDSGKYQSLAGQAQCLLCPVGSATSATGQTTCAQCSIGYVAPLQGSKACTACDSGFFSNVTGQSACFPCALGTVANGTALNQCTECPSGSIQKDLGFSSCVLCPPGTRQPLSGQRTCLPCQMGFATNSSGQTACFACDVGKFTPVNGTRVCAECSVGTATDILGATVCQACQAGFFTSASGFSTCSACAANTYQPASMSGGCLNCTGSVILGATMCLAPGTITANITIATDYSLVTASSLARSTFESAFLADLAQYSGSNATKERYQVLLLTPGSTRVWFAILPPITAVFNRTSNRTELVSTAGVLSAGQVMDGIVRQLSIAPPPNPSLLLNGTVWRLADNTSLVFDAICQNATTGAIYTLHQDAHCRFPTVDDSEVRGPSHDSFKTYAIIVGCSIGGGCLLIGCIFAWCFHRRGVRRREKQVAQWGVEQAQPRDTPIGDEEPDSDEEHVDGVKPHPIVWGY